MASTEDVAIAEGDDGFAEDSKLEGKKKKFKPFQKVRNFFRGSSKKRFKGEGDVTLKSHSISALHRQDGDEDDEGGFKRTSVGLAGSRSISEDSIFKPEQTKEQPIGVLHGTAVSMERINSDFQSELFSKLKGRQSDSDMDEGLPSSPPRTSLTTADVILGGMFKSAPAGGKSTSRESDQSLLSMDGSETEEDLFQSNWQAGVASVKRPSSGSLSDIGMDVSDLDVVEMRTAKLSNEGAKHRISVKPKARRASTKASMKQREKPVAGTQLPGVKEESPSKISVGEPNDNSTEKKPNVTKISTTIAVGTPIPRSEPKDIPHSNIPKDEPDANKSHSMSPLSSSPVSSSMLQDVKLRPRPLSGKFDGVEPKVEKVETGSELSQAFNKAKRFSKKFDDDVTVDTKTSVSKDTAVHVSVKEKEENKFGISLKGVTNVKDDKKTLTEDKKSPTTENKPFTETSKESVVSPGMTGVSFVLKKEPLRSVGTRQGSNEGKSGNVTSFEKTETSVVKSAMKPSETNVSKDVTKSDSVASTTSSKADSGKVSFGSPEKLASPREDYKLKRQTRSKTLPEQPVPKELLDKAKQVDTQKPPQQRLGSPPMSTKVRTSDYDNVTVGSKPFQSKRASWASESPKTGSVSGEPSWIARARAKQADFEKEEKENKGGDAKTEIVKTEEKPVTQTKVNDKVMPKVNVSVSQKSETVTTKTAATTTAVSEKSNVQTNVKSWTTSYTAKPFEKTSNVSSVKAPSVQSSSVATKTAAEKPLNIQIKPSASAQSSIKPSVQSASRSAFDKPPVTGLKHTVEKPTPVSAVKSGGDQTGSQKPSYTTKSAFDSKSITQTSTRPFGSANTNVSKEPIKPSITSVSKEPIKSSVTADTKKTINIETKKLEEKKDTKVPVTSSVTSRTGKTGSTPDAGGVPSWKQKKNSPSQVKIEIIDKTENKMEQKTPERKVEEKKSFVQSREKAKTDTCSDSAANRQSKVLDMVKNFQKLQVT